MKEGFDKEIDSLLRRKARGAAKPFTDGDGAEAASRATAAHLDADELGAFAEGALPAPARLAAASHLADCDRCRGMVVTLSQSHGVAAETETRAAAGAAVAPATVAAERPAAWRAWAAWLFSPRGMRLAVPVLALSAVAVVSYVALRSRDAGAPNTTSRASRPLETTRQQSNANAPAAAATGTATTGAEGLVAQDSGAPAPGGEAAPAQTQPQPPLGRGHGAGEAHPVTSGVADTAPPPPSPSSPAAEGPAEMAKAAPRPVVSEEAPPPQPKSEDRERAARAAEPVDEVAAGDAAAQQQRRAAQSRASNEVQMPDGGARNQRRAGENVTSNNAGANVYGGSVGATAPRESERDRRADEGAGVARRSRPAPRAEKKAGEDDEAARGGETRTAAGRRFRREGGAWVDVNYKPSMSSTGVRRGTEAFRALVADHPEIGRVAGQLGGEVVVVVRGRAYRIR